MPTPSWTRTVIGLFAGIILAISLITGQSIDRNGLRWLSAATGVVIVLLLIYDRWAWRWPLVRKGAELAGRPVVHGTWKGMLDYERDADDQPGSIRFYLAIEQSFSSVRVRGYVSTSESYSLTATIERPMPNRRQMVYAFRSEAPYTSRDSNRPHDGTAVLALAGIPVEEINGSYYNDRLRRGTIKLTEYSPKVAESFNQAEHLNYEAARRSAKP